jgi:hypothetical protein
MRPWSVEVQKRAVVSVLISCLRSALGPLAMILVSSLRSIWHGVDFDLKAPGIDLNTSWGSISMDFKAPGAVFE